jgi:hypothetical protein
VRHDRTFALIFLHARCGLLLGSRCGRRQTSPHPRHRERDDLQARIGTYDKDAGPNNQRLYLNGACVAQMSDTLPIDLNSAALGIGRHVSGVADPFNGKYRRVPHLACPAFRWLDPATWNNMSDPGAFAAASAEEQEGGEPPPLAGAGVLVCVMG